MSLDARSTAGVATASHAEPDLQSLHNIVLSNPRAGEDLVHLQATWPQLAFSVAHGEDWRTQVADAEAILLRYDLGIDEVLAHAPRLRWIHALGAGVDRVLSQRLRDSGILLTNSSGVHATNIAEHILALALSFARQLHVLGRAQARSEWLGPTGKGAYKPLPGVFELEGQTLAVIGLGAIGQALARKAEALGLHVLGVRRSKTGDKVSGAHEVFDASGLDAVLARADHVAITLPLTAETQGLFDAARIARIKRGAYVYNIGRGPIIDSPALLAALDSGHLAGAGLDVTDPEPLPPEATLWLHPKVIITAHTSGSTPHNGARTLRIFSDNIGRALRGEPLHNVVDKQLGY
ncbi:D-2-hydroxyacid dehydrogenase [Uliginosibacterium sp. H1]|uniref:D-2-hydroxyacid dehydrogenase n=1 Tax=Uliginosibacterium sp. H1 TaxID=3114757 RepID=UPI002E184C9E|nr:D-2-hydroxyacid dehydrogenase [Uliginosibacterium sp. H1]